MDTQYNAGRDIHLYQPPLSLTERLWKRNRSGMPERVQGSWIEGVLEPSLPGAAQIALQLQQKPSAIVTPLWQVLQEFEHTGPLPPDVTSIMQVFEHADGEVLILGEPGAGNTTLLLELTRDLLERARRDESQPMPVVFNLSSWATKRHPLTEWLASELHSRYQIPLSLATSWIEMDQVLPLLDGLDEVAAPHRAACVEAINAYRRAHGLLPTVVCSRKADYLALPTRSLLRSAVVVQPLTDQQIETYLSSAGEQMVGLRQALQEDAELHTMAGTPLMLNVLTVAYQGATSEEIAAVGSSSFKRKQVFATYVQRMLKRRSTETRSTLQQTNHWLLWLSKRRSIRLYGVIVRVVLGLIVGLLSGLIIGLFAGVDTGLLCGLQDVAADGAPDTLIRPEQVRDFGNYSLKRPVRIGEYDPYQELIGLKEQSGGGRNIYSSDRLQPQARRHAFLNIGPCRSDIDLRQDL